MNRATVDPGAARRFLKLLDKDATTWSFQTFDDDDTRKDKKLARILHGSFEKNEAVLADLNLRGAGVFVMVQEGDGKGRRNKNVRRIRCVFQEDDGEGRELPLRAQIVNETSPGHFHRYLLVDGFSEEDYKGVQARLIADYGSDPNAKDLARVLRLPGFLHMKDRATPHRVRTVKRTAPKPYERDTVLAALPPLNGAPHPRMDNKPFDRSSILDGVPEGERDVALFKYACSLLKRHVTQEEAGELVAIAARRCTPPFDEVEALAKVSRVYNNSEYTTQDSIGDRETLDNARREQQRKLNEQIGNGDSTIPHAEVMTLDEMLERQVFVIDGSRVADVLYPHIHNGYSDWTRSMAASKMQGEKNKIIPISALWLGHEKRQTVNTLTYKAGGPLFLQNPDGVPALNTWRPYDRSVEPGKASPKLFLEHINFLFSQREDRGSFIDWLSHVEQSPGELPHTAWLHISKFPGTGRNWLASLFARVWAGHVAANLDLVGMLDSQFTGRIARKVLAIIDEIREGGTGNRWRHAERIKSMVTEEIRKINFKYGAEITEYNSMRWLLFSNHVSALPIPRDDRRIAVAIMEDRPRSPDYYAKLYRALDDPLFIATVARYFGQRDLSQFNPGAHARDTEAKRRVQRASQSEHGEWLELMVTHWPVDIVQASILQYAINDEVTTSAGRHSAAIKYVLEEFGVESINRSIRVNGTPTKVVILRNAAHWRNAAPKKLEKEIQAGPQPLQDYQLIELRDYILKLASMMEMNTKM